MFGNAHSSAVAILRRATVCHVVPSLHAATTSSTRHQRMTTKLTALDRMLEYSVEYETRLGHQCGSGKPSPEQRETAAKIAREHIEALRKQDE